MKMKRLTFHNFKNKLVVAFLAYDKKTYVLRCIGGNGADALINATPNTSMLYPQTVIPAMMYSIVPGAQIIATDFIQF